MLISELKVSQKVRDALNHIEKLNPPQEMAVKKGLFQDKNMVIASPTASGKTLIAEMAFLNNFFNGGKSIYLVPLKALASEKFNEFKEKYEKLGMKIAVSVGDYDSAEDWLGRYDLIITSNEKMDSILRHDPEWIRRTTLIICDEIHVIDDASRGPTLEIVLTRLQTSTKSQIIALSATINNAKEIAEWLRAELIESDYRPIKLYKGVYYPYNVDIDEKGSFELEKGDSEVTLSKDTLKKKKQSLVFVSTRRSAEASSEKIAENIFPLLTMEEKIKLKKVAGEIEKSLHIPTKQCIRLASIVRKGAAFHHAGLVEKQRRLVENSFKEGLIKIIVATTSLAFGVNLPSWRVVIRDTKRYGKNGLDYLSVMEVHQMFGRAGRPKYDKEGEAILVAKSERESHELRAIYIEGEPEPVYSKLSSEPALRFHLLSLISSSHIKNMQDVKDFFSKTFFFQQYGDIEEVMEKIRKIMKELESYDFIETERFMSKDFVPAFNVDNFKIKATEMGKRVSNLYLDPRSAYFLLSNFKENKTAMEILVMINKCDEMKPLLNIRKNDDIESEVIKHSLKSPDTWSYEYEDFLQAVKTSLMMNDWINEKNENFLNEQYDVTPGEVYTKTRNAEWMLYALSDLAMLKGEKEKAQEINKLRFRVQNGIKEELLDMIRIKGIGRVRARMLWKNNIKTANDVKNNLNVVEKFFGKKVAQNIKQALTEDLDKKMRRVKRMKK